MQTIATFHRCHLNMLLHVSAFLAYQIYQMYFFFISLISLLDNMCTFAFVFLSAKPKVLEPRRIFDYLHLRYFYQITDKMYHMEMYIEPTCLISHSISVVCVGAEVSMKTSDGSESSVIFTWTAHFLYPLTCLLS